MDSPKYSSRLLWQHEGAAYQRESPTSIMVGGGCDDPQRRPSSCVVTPFNDTEQSLIGGHFRDATSAAAGPRLSELSPMQTLSDAPHLARNLHRPPSRPLTMGSPSSPFSCTDQLEPLAAPLSLEAEMHHHVVHDGRSWLRSENAATGMKSEREFDDFKQAESEDNFVGNGQSGAVASDGVGMHLFRVLRPPQLQADGVRSPVCRATPVWRTDSAERPPPKSAFEGLSGLNGGSVDERRVPCDAAPLDRRIIRSSPSPKSSPPAVSAAGENSSEFLSQQTKLSREVKSSEGQQPCGRASRRSVYSEADYYSPVNGDFSEVPAALFHALQLQDRESQDRNDQECSACAVANSELSRLRKTLGDLTDRLAQEKQRLSQEKQTSFMLKASVKRHAEKIRMLNDQLELLNDQLEVARQKTPKMTVELRRRSSANFPSLGVRPVEVLVDFKGSTKSDGNVPPSNVSPKREGGISDPNVEEEEEEGEEDCHDMDMGLGSGIERLSSSLNSNRSSMATEKVDDDSGDDDDNDSSLLTAECDSIHHNECGRDTQRIAVGEEPPDSGRVGRRPRIERLRKGTVEAVADDGSSGGSADADTEWAHTDSRADEAACITAEWVDGQLEPSDDVSRADQLAIDSAAQQFTMQADALGVKEVNDRVQIDDAVAVIEDAKDSSENEERVVDSNSCSVDALESSSRRSIPEKSSAAPRCSPESRDGNHTHFKRKLRSCRGKKSSREAPSDNVASANGAIKVEEVRQGEEAIAGDISGQAEYDNESTECDEERNEATNAPNHNNGGAVRGNKSQGNGGGRRQAAALQPVKEETSADDVCAAGTKGRRRGAPPPPPAVCGVQQETDAEDECESLRKTCPAAVSSDVTSTKIPRAGRAAKCAVERGRRSSRLNRAATAVADATSGSEVLTAAAATTAAATGSRAPCGEVSGRSRPSRRRL